MIDISLTDLISIKYKPPIKLMVFVIVQTLHKVRHKYVGNKYRHIATVKLSYLRYNSGDRHWLHR